MEALAMPLRLFPAKLRNLAYRGFALTGSGVVTGVGTTLRSSEVGPWSDPRSARVARSRSLGALADALLLGGLVPREQALAVLGADSIAACSTPRGPGRTGGGGQ